MDYIQNQIEKTTKYLPNIRPLTEFIHFNLYPGLQNQPFWNAIENLSIKYSVAPLPYTKFYQKRWRLGSIDKRILNEQINRFVRDPKDQKYINELLFREVTKVHLPEKTYRPIGKFLNEKINYSLKELTEPLLIRFLSGFYDQGISEWKLPFSNLSLINCFFEFNKKSFFPIYPITKKLLNQIENKSSTEIIDFLLSKAFEDEKLKECYLEECLLSLKGWSAFISNISSSPELFQQKRKSSLLDYLAIRLIIERAWLDALMPKLKPLDLNDFGNNALEKKAIINDQDWLLYKIWHESLEKTFHYKTLAKIKKNIIQEDFKKDDSSNGYGAELKVYQFQAMFCIDDRECSLRRGLEELSEDIQTFGTPGHFGLDFSFKESEGAYPKKQCPAPVEPKFFIQAKRINTNKLNFLPGKKLFTDHTHIHNLFFDILDSVLVGFFYGFKLFSKVFFEKKYSSVFASEGHITDYDVLKSSRNISDSITSDPVGLTHEQAADRLNVVFSTTGLNKNFSKIVYILGHESTTTNNPYFNAYGCGACSGRSGHINSIVFSRYANDLKVRFFLKTNYNIEIPIETHFVAGVHNTTKDTIVFFDIENLPLNLKNQHSEFLKIKNEALINNAKTRALDFELIDHKSKKTNWLDEMSLRSYSIFEPRPELGHTGNALCIIGKRSTTRRVSFDRRAFLQSYDWSIDPDGKNLNLILSAAVPVCGGINLDYFFARINSHSIGAGSKLSHNVVGLTALSHGTEDDLLAGLAGQMVELHDPLRIMFVIEQELHVVQSVIENNKGIQEWIENEWIRFSCLCPLTHDLFYFEDGRFSKFEGSIYE